MREEIPMVKMLTDQSREKQIDPEDRRKEYRLVRVRDYVRKHSQARQVGLIDEGMTKKQLLAAPLLAYILPDCELEYIVSKKVFRDVVCDGIAWQLALENLKAADYLNHSLGSLLATRAIGKRLKTRVVSIKPEILQYTTEEEEQTLRTHIPYVDRERLQSTQT
jgi:hypothetical protein